MAGTEFVAADHNEVHTILFAEAAVPSESTKKSIPREIRSRASISYSGFSNEIS